MVQADAGSRDESDGAQIMVCRLDMRGKERGAVFGVFRSYLSAMLRKYERDRASAPVCRSFRALPVTNPHLKI